MGATRHCDFPDGGFVDERATEWEEGRLLRLNIFEGSVPFNDYYGTYVLSGDGDSTLAKFSMEYEISSDSALDPGRVEQRNRDRFIPSVLGGLKQYIEGSGLTSTGN